MHEVEEEIEIKTQFLVLIKTALLKKKEHAS